MSELYGILVHSERTGTSLYRTGSQSGDDGKNWTLEEAERTAYELLTSDRRYIFVGFGNGEHEFRAWDEHFTNYGNFNHPNLRWAEWYVDVEIDEHRWRFRPCADLNDWAAAEEMAHIAVTLHPVVTRVWMGRSDGSEESQFDLEGS